jgi:hypothetical protein
MQVLKRDQISPATSEISTASIVSLQMLKDSITKKNAYGNGYGCNMLE